MKALLVAMNAKYIHSNLGIYSIRAYGVAHGIPASDLEIAEYTINQRSEDVLADIYRRQPEWIGFSCYIWNIREITELAVELHKVLPDTPIWFGGPEVTFHANQLVKQYSWLSGIMIGEGEATFLELYHAYDSGSSLERVAGLVYRETQDRVIQTLERPKLPMDDLVFPYADMEGLAHRIIYYETSRGCPFGCSYCLSSVDRQVRLRSMELVEKELQFFLDQRVPQVKFVDRTFNCNRQHTMAIWKYIYEHDNGVTNFHFEISADLLNDEEIEYVKQFRPGLVQFEIGVQSTNPNTMQAIHRVCDLDRLRNRVERIRAGRNIHQHLDLIAGLPYEDYDSFRQSYNDVHRMKPDQLQLGFLKMLKGSPIEGQHDALGIVCQEHPPYEVLFTPWLPYDDVLRLKQVEDMTERYYNSLQFEASRPYLESLFETPFDFYQSLGEYYQEQGYAGLHQSRLQNYEILLEFLSERTDGDSHILRQLLLYDLYARENLKSRPEFVEHASGADWQERIRKFYQNPLWMMQYLPEYQGYDWKQMLRMTHLEPFDFDIIQYVSEKKLIQKNCVLLFDYRQRNPLSHQARIVDVTERV